LSARDRLARELALCDDDDEPEGEYRGAEDDGDDSMRSMGFGERMLKQLGWKPGQALRPGASATQYVPKVTGGFTATNTASHDVSAVKVGSVVVVLPGGANMHGGKVAAVLRSRGNDLELQFGDAARGVAQRNDVRHAGNAEQADFATALAEATGSAKRARDDVAPAVPPPAPAPMWAVPKLVVRVVEGTGINDAPFEPFKDTVRSVDRAACTVTLAGGATVPGAAIDTVVPRAGQRGLVVLGKKRGVIATVTGKRRAAASGAMVVPVQGKNGGTDDEISVEEICLMEL
jgi:hypothetical protein